MSKFVTSLGDDELSNTFQTLFSACQKHIIPNSTWVLLLKKCFKKGVILRLLFALLLSSSLFQHEFLSLCLWASFHPQKRDIPIPTFHDFWRFFEVDNYLDVFWGVSGTKYFNKNWTNYIRFSSSIQSAYLPKIRQTCLFFCRKIDGNRKRKWHRWFSPPTFWPMVGKMMVEKYANVSPALVTFDMGWKSSKHVWGLGPHQEAAAFNGTNHDHHENFGKNSIWHPKQSCFGNIFNWFRLEFLSWLPNRLRSFPNKDDAMMLCAKKKTYQRHFKVAPWKI